ncbi:hypothetical protein [Thalassotalea aquiviva]|uniref:hypothetical protein n=1 Tax=Thalassotalea aquiviva TaxID=3242415 RepID=UPI003529DF3C
MPTSLLNANQASKLVSPPLEQETLTGIKQPNLLASRSVLKLCTPFSANKHAVSLSSKQTLENKAVNKSANKAQGNIHLIETFSNTVLSERIYSICKPKVDDKRWLLCIGGSDEMIADMALKTANPYILKVNSVGQKVKFEQLKRALLKGNLATLVLFNSSFDQKRLSELSDYAVKGNTQCIVINPSLTLH